MNIPPYFAAQIVPFLQGTKGGPRTNEFGQVQSVLGGIVPRLYACGNNAGCGTPGKYYNGAGGTVAPAWSLATWPPSTRRGWRAGSKRTGGVAPRGVSVGAGGRDLRCMYDP